MDENGDRLKKKRHVFFFNLKQSTKNGRMNHASPIQLLETRKKWEKRRA